MTQLGYAGLHIVQVQYVSLLTRLPLPREQYQVLGVGHLVNELLAELHTVERLVSS